MFRRLIDNEVAFETRIPVNYQYTPVLVNILQHLQASLVVSTYQSGKILVNTITRDMTPQHSQI
ncbi:MAG: hypothetical protein WKF77_06510 [Planctomycetaceae bacterium]